MTIRRLAIIATVVTSLNVAVPAVAVPASPLLAVAHAEGGCKDGYFPDGIEKKFGKSYLICRNGDGGDTYRIPLN